MTPRSAALALLLAAAGACQSSEPAKDPAQQVPVATAKDPVAAKQLVAAGAVVVDVRTPEEYAEGHVINAVNLPVQTFAAADVDKLTGGDKSKPVVVYCAAGKRAAKAKAALDAAGYTTVVNGGGYDDLVP